MAQSQPLCLHRGGDHFKGLARTYLVCQQRVTAIEDMGDSPQLVIPQGNGRVHAAKGDVGPVVFTGPGGVHFLIVLAHQRLTALRVFPNPVFESIPDGLLLLSCQGGLFGIQHPALFAVRVLHSVIDTDIPQV